MPPPELLDDDELDEYESLDEDVEEDEDEDEDDELLDDDDDELLLLSVWELSKRSSAPALATPGIRRTATARRRRTRRCSARRGPGKFPEVLRPP